MNKEDSLQFLGIVRNIEAYIKQKGYEITAAQVIHQYGRYRKWKEVTDVFEDIINNAIMNKEAKHKVENWLLFLREPTNE